MIATLFYDRMGRQPPAGSPTSTRVVGANVSRRAASSRSGFWTRTSADWLLWIDADIRWSPLDVDVLLDAADPNDGAGDRRAVFGMTTVNRSRRSLPFRGDRWAADHDPAAYYRPGRRHDRTSRGHGRCVPTDPSQRLEGDERRFQRTFRSSRDAERTRPVRGRT